MTHDAASRDLTQGPVGSAVLALAVPMVIEMVMESTFAIVDIFFVGKLGTEAIATVGLTESLITLIYTIAMGLSIGASAVVARRIGAKEPEQAAVAAVQALVLGLAFAVPTGILGGVFAPDLLALMGADESVVATGASYARVLLGSNFVVLLLFLVNAIFRGAGNGKIAMHAVGVANLINIALCPTLVFGLGPFPELGVTGAAVATTVARGVGLAYVVARLFLGGAGLHVKRQHLALAPAVMRSILRLSSSAAVQVFIGMASWIGLMRTISTFGSAALAGYTIGIRIIVFALLPAVGLGNAAATMVGQSLGAKRAERAEQAVWTAGLYNVVFLGGVGICFLALAPKVVTFFTVDPEAFAHAVDCLRVIAIGFPFYAYAIVLGSAFNGAGDTWTPTWVNLLVFWLFEIPLAVGLSTPLGMGPRGVFLAVLLAFSTLAVVCALLFKRGGWKTRVI
jgi:putative MATE family efflux protein